MGCPFDVLSPCNIIGRTLPSVASDSGSLSSAPFVPHRPGARAEHSFIGPEYSMRKCTYALFAILCLFATLAAQQEARLLRFPAIHDSRIVFTYAGDLYTVASAGGIARKLTNSEGFEM